MDKKLKAKWIKALRSGKYQQAREMLVGGHGAYCCLGVLSRICSPRTPKYKLDYPAFDILNSSQQRALASRNDGNDGFQPHDFAKIADYIEANH